MAVKEALVRIYVYGRNYYSSHTYIHNHKDSFIETNANDMFYIINVFTDTTAPVNELP